MAPLAQSEIASRLHALQKRVSALEAAGASSQDGVNENDQISELLRRLEDLGGRVAKLEEPAVGRCSSLPKSPHRNAAEIVSTRGPLQCLNPRPYKRWRTSAGAADATEERLGRELRSRGVENFVFKRVPADYYDRDLEYRRECLAPEAASVNHLCKSIIMENTKAPADFEESGPFEASRFYCVIVQYAARMHADKLKRFLHKLNGKLGLKHFNMRLAQPHDSDRLTSFTHNAVSPVGMSTRLPIVLSHRIDALQPEIFFLGGGEVDLKLGTSVAAFKQAYQPLVVDCTYDEETADNTSCLSA